MNPIIDRLEAYLKPQWILIVSGTNFQGGHSRNCQTSDEKTKLIKLVTDYISQIDSEETAKYAKRSLEYKMWYEHVYKTGNIIKYIGFRLVPLTNLSLDQIYSQIKAYHSSRE